MTLIEFIEANLPLDEPIICAVCLGIIFIISYDFYHMLFSAVLSWFKRKTK